MEELQIKISQEPAVIRCNFEDVKAQLSAKMAEYQGAVFTEESKSVAKAELASLRKTRDEVEKRRKEVKAQCLVPYNDFEEKVKELLEIIDEPICLIDSQLKEMEAERIRKRHADVETLYAECAGEWAEYLPLKEIYVKKWDNATTSLKQIEKELLTMIEKVSSEVAIIRNTQSDVVDDALQIYQKSRELGAALTRINTYEDNKKRALEAERIRRQQEEEQRRQVKYVLIPAQYEHPESTTKKGRGRCVERECAYIADFVYKTILPDGDTLTIVEDTKGFRTKDYIIKRKLMLSVYGIRIREI